MDTLDPGVRPGKARISHPITKRNYTEEFRRDAVELYRDTDGATVAGIAADLGISHSSLTTWLKNAGIPMQTRHQQCTTARPRRNTRAGSRQAPRRGRASTRGENQARDRARHPAVGGQILRRRDELVNRFQFVADHSDTYPAKRLCEVIDIARSSY